LPVEPCSSLDEAVRRAHAEARPGDVVLLAPACSSFDMFTDYADRGRSWKAEIARLAEAARG
jgi:UDP-N-acetylmuramoylalanine--D-glutamate ligase